MANPSCCFRQTPTNDLNRRVQFQNASYATGIRSKRRLSLRSVSTRRRAGGGAGCIDLRAHCARGSTVSACTSGRGRRRGPLTPASSIVARVSAKRHPGSRGPHLADAHAGYIPDARMVQAKAPFCDCHHIQGEWAPLACGFIGDPSPSLTEAPMPNHRTFLRDLAANIHRLKLAATKKYAYAFLCGLALALGAPAAVQRELSHDEMVCRLDPQCAMPIVHRRLRGITANSSPETPAHSTEL